MKSHDRKAAEVNSIAVLSPRVVNALLEVRIDGASDLLSDLLRLNKLLLERVLLGLVGARLVVAVQGVLARRLGESVRRSLSEREARVGIRITVAGSGALSARAVVSSLEATSGASTADRRVRVSSEPVCLVELVLGLKMNVLDLLALQKLLDNPLEALTALDHVADESALEVLAVSRHVVLESFVAATDAHRDLFVLLLDVEALRTNQIECIFDVNDGNGQDVLLHKFVDLLVELVGLAGHKLDRGIAEELFTLLIELGLGDAQEIDVTKGGNLRIDMSIALERILQNGSGLANDRIKRNTAPGLSRMRRAGTPRLIMVITMSLFT